MVPRAGRLRVFLLVALSGGVLGKEGMSTATSQLVSKLSGLRSLARSNLWLCFSYAWRGGAYRKELELEHRARAEHSETFKS